MSQCWVFWCGVRTFPITSFPGKERGESVSMNSCMRKAVHNKDIMKNITLIHIDFCFVCWLVPLLPWQSHEQCHPSSANEKTSDAAVRLP